MSLLSDPLRLARGPAWPNRLTLAPLTNMQSNSDGTLSDDEHDWLVRRAQGGFAMTMTCAANVSADGQDRKSTRELQSLMRISYAVFCLKKQTTHSTIETM